MAADRRVVDDDAGAYPAIGAVTPGLVVPRRRGASTATPPSEGLWTSYEFWMGIVAGAGAVLLVKTVLAVQAPFGLDWYVF
jgi:hypothetical protein